MNDQQIAQPTEHCDKCGTAINEADFKSYDYLNNEIYCTHCIEQFRKNADKQVNNSSGYITYYTSK